MGIPSRVLSHFPLSVSACLYIKNEHFKKMFEKELSLIWLLWCRWWDRARDPVATWRARRGPQNNLHRLGGVGVCLWRELARRQGRGSW